MRARRDQIVERGGLAELAAYGQDFVIRGVVFGSGHKDSIGVVEDRPKGSRACFWILKMRKRGVSRRSSASSLQQAKDLRHPGAQELPRRRLAE